jgi:hypothetical protein
MMISDAARIRGPLGIHDEEFQASQGAEKVEDSVWKDTMDEQTPIALRLFVFRSSLEP